MPNQASATNTSARTTRNTKARNTRNISARKTTRNNLPINLRVNIVKQLTVQDRLRMGQVSKNNHSLIHKNSKLLQAIRAIIRPTNNRPTNNLNANRAQKIINHVNTLTNTNKHNQILTSFTSLKDPMGKWRLKNVYNPYTVQIRNRGIKNADMKHFSTAIASGALASCTTLDLSMNQIGDAGMQVFSTAIAGGALASCDELYLHSNQIGDVGMQAFSTALAGGALADLYILTLGGNQIGDQGMIAFSGALATGALASLMSIQVDEFSHSFALEAVCGARRIDLF